MSSALGWVSLGLGLTELLAPGRVARVVGARETRTSRKALRALGLREIAGGVTVLSRPGSAGPMWSRVAGDAVALAALTTVMATARRRRGWTALAMAAVAGMTACDVACAVQLRARPMELSAF
jgi:ribosomal protein L30/L7E